MPTESHIRDQETLRERLPVRLPPDVDIHLRYTKRSDILTIMIGPQNRWPVVTRVDGNATIHLEDDGTMVRIELTHASKAFQLEWLQKHARNSGPRRRLGLP